MHGRAGPLVQAALVADPEVDFPVKALIWIKKRVQNNVTVAIEQFAVVVLIDLQTEVSKLNISSKVGTCVG